MQELQEPRPRWSQSTKLTVALLMLGLLIYLLTRFSAALQPMILAAILAYLLNPLANRIERRLHLPRGLATLLALGLVLLIMAAIPLLLIPPLTTQLAEMNLDLQRSLNRLQEFLNTELLVAGQVINPGLGLQQTVGSLQGLLEPVVNRTLEYVVGILSSLVWGVFILVAGFYLAKDAAELGRWARSLVPEAYQTDFAILQREISLIWAAFFRGQLTLAAVVATIFTIVGVIIGLPFALAMGILAGILEFLPSIGHGIWLTTASLLALLLGSTWLPLPKWVFWLLLVGLHVFFQQFDLNYLIPRIIGRRVHLPPLVVILGIVTGALLAGFLGIFLAAPTIASARVLGRYIYANLLDQNPFPTSIATPLPPPDARWWHQKTYQRQKDEAGQKPLPPAETPHD